MTDEVLREAIAAVKAGDKRRARRLLGQIVNNDPDNLAAWWYLAAVLDDRAQKIHCLQQILRIRPDHEEARKLLARLEQRVVDLTPPKGTPRPVLETRNTIGGLRVVPDEDEPSGEQGRGSDVTVALVAVGLALVAIVVTVVLTQTGLGSRLFGINAPELGPTLRSLTFGVEACTATENSNAATLVFINNTGVPVDILRGAQGEETLLLSLDAGEQGQVETRSGALVRYVIDTEAEGIVGSGAEFHVPAGNTCLVPLQ